MKRRSLLYVAIASLCLMGALGIAGAAEKKAKPEATVEILLTWAADERRNWVEVDGTEGRIELHDDTLVLKGRSGERRWPGLPALSDGSHHPDWFHKVAERFLAALSGRPVRDGNLAEAALCAEIEHLARESSRRGGVELPLGPVTLAGAGI